MSRVGKTPIPIPEKTKITYKDRVITVQGEKGTLKRTVHPAVDLKIEDGIGYRATLSGNVIEFNLGYSHPIKFDLPEGISASVDKKNVIRLNGIDKELLGHAAASIRRLRPPECYKGKGIKYAEEYIQRKAGKAGTKAA